MNKFFAMMVALLATVFATSAFAWDPPPSPAPTSWISDPGHVLSADAHARLDAKLKVINQSSANEMAALILPSLNGESIEDAGDLTSKAWGVGKKNLDNGVLVVLAMKEHKSRISTGKGVEGDLPDLKCNDILQAMRPYLRSGNVEGALGYAFDQSSTLIANHKAEAAAQAAKGVTAPAPAAPQPQAVSNSNRNGGCQVAAPGSDTSVFPWVLALLGLGLFGWYLSRRSAARSRERLAQLDAETEALLRQQRERAERLQREAQMSIPTPIVEVPVVPSVSRPVAPSFPVAPVAAVAAVVAAEEAPRPHYTAPKKHHHTSHSSHSSSSSSSSSSDSSPSFSWGGGSSDSGGSGSFGGGDSGGGGSSSDW